MEIMFSVEVVDKSRGANVAQRFSHTRTEGFTQARNARRGRTDDAR
jgi:hypothetical protein